jgi:hypothetical protein
MLYMMNLNQKACVHCNLSNISSSDCLPQGPNRGEREESQGCLPGKLLQPPHHHISYKQNTSTSYKREYENHCT